MLEEHKEMQLCVTMKSERASVEALADVWAAIVATA